ncbi:hypothetical protein JKF63_07866 [Porcisia hertigi]|uniref:Uncharacterized protein n=1 Tax=Porcisia hertigi TaxID=2761500 RepID=A0A836YH82_9TRYP|nr:hypothetical protein JKF63_07866 [Porcisia hertigi]
MYNFHKRADAARRVDGNAGVETTRANEGCDYEEASTEPRRLPEDGGCDAQQHCYSEPQGYPKGGSRAPVEGSAERYLDYGPEDPGAYDMTSYTDQGNDPHKQPQHQQAYLQPQGYAQGGEAQGEEEDAHMFADYRGPIDGERAERYNRRMQQQKQYDDIPVPPDDASPQEVFAYYRKLIGLVHFVPPRHWREIRFDLPANVAELRLYPQRRERVQDREPIRPTSCIAISLKGMLPENTTPSEYAAQMVQYMFDLLNYQNASTAMTELRFVKKGTELLQMVVTLGKDTRLAGRVLTELQAAGLRAYYGKPVFEFPPNATFQVVDYRRTLHDGKGISADDVTFLLEPIRQYNTVDINVIEGYEPGVFYAPVKRPETVYSFLWNYFCSYKFQSDLFRRYGVLVTMAQCPHEFLQKGIPYHIQKQQLEEKIRLELQRKGMAGREGDGYGGGAGGGGEDDDDSDDGVAGDADGATGEGPPPAWAANAADEIDIFSSSSPASRVQQQSSSADLFNQPKHGSGHGTAAATGNTVATAITFVDEEGLEDVDALLKQYNAVTEPPPSAAKTRKGKEATAAVSPAAASGAGHGNEGGGDAPPDGGGPRGGAYLLPPPAAERPSWGGGHGNCGSEQYGTLPHYAPDHGACEYPQAHQPPQYCPPSAPYGSAAPGAPPELYYGPYPSSAPPPQASPYPGIAPPSSGLYPAPPYVHRDGNTHNSAPEALTAAAAASGGGGGAPSAYPLLVDEADDEQSALPQQQPPLSSWMIENGNGGTLTEQQHQQPLPTSSQALVPALHENDMLLSWSMDEGLASSAVPGYAGPSAFAVPLPHHPPRSGVNDVGQEVNGEGSGMQGYDSYWPVFGESHTRQLNTFESIAGVGGVLGDCDPAPPSYLTGEDIGGYSQPPQHTAAPWGYADDYSGPAMTYSEPMPMPPHVREAADIAADLVERIQAAFPATWAAAADPSAQPFLLDGEALENHDEWDISEETNSVLQHIPEAAAAAVWDLPPPTTEIKELLSFLHRNVSLVGRLLHKTTTTTVEQAAEVSVFRARVARALLIGATLPVGMPQSPASPEALHAAWEQSYADGNGAPAQASVATQDGKSEELAKAEEASPETQLPALLPYLLRTPSGVDLAMLLAFHYPRAFARRFLPYAPAYLFHENVVRVVFTTALRRDAAAENVLVRHILAHWCPLMLWLLRVAHHKTGAKPNGAETSVTAVAGKEGGGVANAMKQLASTLGCTMDALLAVLSPSQREACRACSETHGYVAAFSEAVRSNEAHGQVECSGAPPLLWGPDGALYRSLVRLYVNADVCDGAKVAARMLSVNRTSSSSSSPMSTSLASAEVCLTREHYYYCVALLSRSHTAPVLSRETAAFCGTFLKLLELQHTRWQQQQQPSNANEEGSTTATAPSVSEKEAEQLLDNLFKAMQTIDVYTALRDAYLAVEVPITRFEAVLARLSSAVPAEALRLQVPTLEEWYSGNDVSKSGGMSNHSGHPPRKRGPEAPPIPNIFYYRPPPRRNMRVNQPQQQQTSSSPSSQTTANATAAGGGKSGTSGSGKGHASIASRWRPEWTAAMRSYPPSGNPFAALPEGWTSRQSRGYGHYYFKPPADPASPADGAATASTYKHPVDGKEHLVTPQAFLLQEAGGDVSTSSATLDKVRTRANTLHAEEAAASSLPPPAELTTKDAEDWLSDQRRRNVFLDVSAMELLGITYRVTTAAAAGTGAEAGKRGRGAVAAAALTPEQLQQLLTKAIPPSYPPVGAPYPAVGRGWSVYFNSARGQYGFSGPTSGPSQPPLFIHPKTRMHYFISPQAFVQQRKVNFDVVARSAGVEKKDVVSWMDDQRTRHLSIDAAVVKLIPITYGDVDKAIEENVTAAEVAGESAAAAAAVAAPVAPTRDRDQQNPSSLSSRHRSDREGRGKNNSRRRQRYADSGSDASHSDDGNRDSDDNTRTRHRRRRERSPRRRGGNGGGDRRRR